MNNKTASLTSVRGSGGVMQRLLNNKLLLFITLASLMIIPIVVGDDYIYHIFITICLFAGLSTAWNIVGGYAGQLSLGHAIYYGLSLIHI